MWIHYPNRYKRKRSNPLSVELEASKLTISPPNQPHANA